MKSEVGTSLAVAFIILCVVWMNGHEGIFFEFSNEIMLFEFCNRRPPHTLIICYGFLQGDKGHEWGEGWMGWGVGLVA